MAWANIEKIEDIWFAADLVGQIEPTSLIEVDTYGVIQFRAEKEITNVGEMEYPSFHFFENEMHMDEPDDIEDHILTFDIREGESIGQEKLEEWDFNELKIEEESRFRKLRFRGEEND